MTIVNVMHPKTKEIVKIDTDVVKDWKEKFLHRSWVPFMDDKEVAVQQLKDLSDKDLEAIMQDEEEVQEIVQDEKTIEELRSEYRQVTGKNLSIRYKNDREWITNKIYEAKK